MSDFIDAVIRFILDHNEAVVQWLFVLVVAWGALLLGMSIFRKEPEEGDESMGALNPNIQAVPTETLQMLTEVTKLKDELIQRGREVETLKTELSTSKTAGPAVDTSKFEAKISELEGKLAEYEILEDDIADLSLYKEENVRLKAELAKAGGAIPSVTAASLPQATTFEPPSEPAGLAGVEPPPTPIPDDKLVEEFASAVEKTKETKEPAAEASDDLLREFADSIGGGGDGPEAEPTEVADYDDLDTDKMIAEVAAMEATADDPAALDEDADMDKMAAEANKLLGQDS